MSRKKKTKQQTQMEDLILSPNAHKSGKNKALLTDYKTDGLRKTLNRKCHTDPNHKDHLIRS